MEQRVKEFLKEWADKYLDRYKTLVGNGKLSSTAINEVRIKGNDMYILLHLQDYWYWLENGRNAGKQPPIKAMLKLAKDIEPIPYKLPSGKIVVPTAEQRAYLIGRKIGKVGTPATHYLRDTTKDMEAELHKELS